MYSLLVALSVIGADPQRTAIYNGSSLVNRDWTAVTTSQSKNRYGSPTQSATFTVLSLRSGDRWDSGKAWVFRIPESGTPEAFKGYYTLYSDSEDEDNIIVSLRMTRRYTGSGAGSGIVWDLDSKWQPTGVDADLPIAERTVPKNVTLTARQAFYVDSRGNRTRKYYKPSGFVDTLLHSGEEDVPYRVDFLRLNDTFQLNDQYAASALQRLASFPPSYLPRTGQR
jgi:hypothetical protein